MSADDPTPDLLADHVLSRHDQFDPFARHEELSSSVVVLPQPLGGGVTIVKTDEPSFARPSAVVR